MVKEPAGATTISGHWGQSRRAVGGSAAPAGATVKLSRAMEIFLIMGIEDNPRFDHHQGFPRRPPLNSILEPSRRQAMQTNAERPLLMLAYGFRPFFLLAGIYGTLAVAVWTAAYVGALPLPRTFS